MISAFHFYKKLIQNMGRLFDAVASIAGIRNNIAYNGQAAMELESVSSIRNKKLYEYFLDNNEIVSIDVRPMIREIVLNLEKGLYTGMIGRKFHNTLIRVLADICNTIKKNTGLNRVALSGGVFLKQNFIDRID